MNLEAFANDIYFVLKTLNLNQFDNGEECFIPYGQEELSKILNISKSKTNKIMKKLVELGCIEPYHGKRGKYQITQVGQSVLYSMNAIIISPRHSSIG